MDRVQKSKLLLHKKAMEVSARVLGLEGWQGSGCGSQEPWTGHLGQGLPQASIQQQAQWPVGFLVLHLLPGCHADWPTA